MKMKIVSIVILCLMAFLCVSCGKKTADIPSDDSVNDNSVIEEAEVAPKFYKLYMDVPVNMTEDVLNSHSMYLSLDEKKIHDFGDGKYYTQLLDVEEGPHSIVLIVDESPVVDSNFSFEIKEDTCVNFTLDYQEELHLGEITTSNSIADSAITYDDMANVELNEALEQLNNKHFVNVKYESIDDASIYDVADWMVVSQNITPGDAIDKADEIVLSCRKVYFQFYFDLEFDENLFLATYDIDVYLDGTMIDTIPHGNNFTYLTRLKEGDHEVVFYKNTNHEVKATKNINISTDSTLVGRLHSNNKDIELNDFVVKDSIENTSFEVANVEGMILDSALSTLGGIGFINLSEEPSGDIWDRSNWVVISQSVKAGEVKDKNTPITLSCIKRSDYLSKYYLKLSIPEAVKKAEEMNNMIRFVDYVQNVYMDNKVSSMSAEDKEKWIVKQASYDSETINLAFVYTGNVEMPDVKSKPLPTALNMLKTKGFSAIETVTDDGSYIWDSNDWKVSKQSVDPGLLVNANGLITITVTSNKPQTTTSNSSQGNSNNTSNSSSSQSGGKSSDDDKAAYSFTTNDKSTYKNGNSGKYAYKTIGGQYDQYYIIDFDEGYVYYFTEGNGEDSCDRLKIQSGDLNSVLIVTYHDGSDVWSNGLRFKYKNQPDQLILQLDPAQGGFEYKFVSTNLKDATEIRDTKRIVDY